METTELDAPPVTDRCPYSRRFGPDFDDCVAYTQEEFTALDTGYKPLRPVLTCRNLAIGTDSGGGFYPRCALGTAEDRVRWAHDVGPDRLAELRDLSLEYRTWVATQMPLVWESKGRLLAARAEKRDTKAATEYMQQRVDELIEAGNRWIDSRAEQLSAVGLDGEILKSLIVRATDEWVKSPGAGMGYQVPDHILEQFPPQIQTFIRAGR
jgi:hypothetical protein